MTAGALEAATEVLHREAAALDEQRWDDWLALFAPDCEYWVPMWRDEEHLTGDPRTELSHIYYANRAGLEDRVQRIRSRRSPASMPIARTTHLVSNVLLVDPPAADRLRVRSSWASHVFVPRARESHAFFGHSLHELAFRDGGWLIARKKVVLQNDYIPTMMDVYYI